MFTKPKDSFTFKHFTDCEEPTVVRLLCFERLNDILLLSLVKRGIRLDNDAVLKATIHSQAIKLFCKTTLNLLIECSDHVQTFELIRGHN
jgi:hypothetical protein